MFRLRNVALGLLVVVALMLGAIFAAGLYRLPGSAELEAPYRTAGLPTRLDEVNPNLVAALDAEGYSLTRALARSACASSDRGLLGWHLCLAVCDVSARLFYSPESLQLWSLNATYFGRGAFGVSAGAQSWFGKDQRDLTLAEATLLVALTRAPALDDSRLRRMLDRLADRMQIPEDARDAAMAGIVERR